MPPAPPAETAPDDPVTALIARQLAMTLPPECIAGVDSNLTLLAGHWANLRAFAAPGDPE